MSTMISLYQKLYSEYSAIYKGNLVIFLLVGKFYELYDIVNEETGEGNTSMKRAVEKMNIVLKEDIGKGPNGETVLKAGLPEQSLHKFAQVLTRDGWTVVIVDQQKDSDNNVIDRIPTRILSAGTHYETAVNERMSIAGLYIGSDSKYSASVIDITTGEVFSLETNKCDAILHMFQVYSVKEVIVKYSELATQMDESIIRSQFGIQCHLNVSTTPIPNHIFSEDWREGYFRKVFRLKSLLPIRISLYLPDPSNNILEIGLCITLKFMEDHFPSKMDLLQSHSVYNPDSYVRISNNMLEQLNILTNSPSKRSVLDLVNKAHCSIGQRAIRERILRPITNPDELENRWNEIDWVQTNIKSVKEKESHIRGICDIPRLHYRISAGSPTVREILQLFHTYSHVECLLKEFIDTPLGASEILINGFRKYRDRFKRSFDETKAIARENGGSDGYLTSNAAPKTHRIEEQIRGTINLWNMQWNTFCDKNGIDASGFVLRRDDTGDLTFEGPRSLYKVIDAAIKKNSSGLKDLTCDMKKSGPLSITCSSLTTCMKQCYEYYRELDSNFREELRKVCDSLWDDIHSIQDELVTWIGRIDSTLTLASVSLKLKWTRPRQSKVGCLNIEGLRHPLLEDANTSVEYVKHTVKFGDGKAGGWLVYGVNASGKSSLMKATGIAVLLAQAGSFVPADSMVFRPYDATFSRIWNHDNIWAGLSSFAVEVGELRDILTYATERSLVLGDEVCSGTESISATSLIASTLEYLEKKGSHFMFATHLHDLLKIPNFLPRPGIAVWHLRVIRTLDGKLIYDRTLQEGSGSSTYGLEVAKAMGLPFSIMERAYEIRRQLDGEDVKSTSWNSNMFVSECEMCHSKISNTLEVHHVERRADGGSNNIRNLTVLCEKCHDAHHNGTQIVYPAVQTSAGIERLKPDIRVDAEPIPSKSKWSKEEMETILSALTRLKGRPMKRICADLKEQGIIIKEAHLSRIHV